MNMSQRYNPSIETVSPKDVGDLKQGKKLYEDWSGCELGEFVMNENYNGVGLGALPAGYGDTPTEGVVPVTQELPSPEDGSGEYGWAPGDLWRKALARRGEAAEEEEEEEDAEEEERSSFWSNLASSFSRSSEEAGPERLPASGTKSGFAYHRYPDGRIEVIEGSNAGATYSASSPTAEILEDDFGPYPSAQGSRASEGSEVVSAEEATARGSALGAGVGGFVQSVLPTFMEMFGPQIEEQPLVVDETLPEVQQAGFPWVPIVAIVAVGGVGFVIYKQVKKK
jgi:hypothetical protein